MKKYCVTILVLVIIATGSLFGCEKKQAALPPPAQPAVTPLPAPVSAPEPAPASKPAPAKPAKK